jgi:hypothetical protein
MVGKKDPNDPSIDSSTTTTTTTSISMGDQSVASIDSDGLTPSAVFSQIMNPKGRWGKKWIPLSSSGPNLFIQRISTSLCSCCLASYVPEVRELFHIRYFCLALIFSLQRCNDFICLLDCIVPPLLRAIDPTRKMYEKVMCTTFSLFVASMSCQFSNPGDWHWIVFLFIIFRARYSAFWQSKCVELSRGDMDTCWVVDACLPCFSRKFLHYRVHHAVLMLIVAPVTLVHMLELCCAP